MVDESKSEETKERPQTGTYEYAINQGATEEQARAYVAEEAARQAHGDGPILFLHSGVRKRHTRHKRRLAAVHHALVQHIGGLIVRRTRPVPLTREKLAQIHDEVKKGFAEGRLELRTPDGRLVDVNTLEPMVGPYPSIPLPNPLLDSASRDKPAGMHIPRYEGGTGLGQETAPPAVLPDGEGEEDEEESTQTIPPLPPGGDPPADPPVPNDDPPTPLAADAPASASADPAVDPEAAPTGNETTEASGETMPSPSAAPSRPSQPPGVPKLVKSKRPK